MRMTYTTLGAHLLQNTTTVTVKAQNKELIPKQAEYFVSLRRCPILEDGLHRLQR